MTNPEASNTPTISRNQLQALLDEDYDLRKAVREYVERERRRAYWSTVRAIVEAAVRECRRYDDREAYIHESVDGNWYITYTRGNLEVLLFTEHDDAFQDAQSSVTGAAFEVLQTLAFYAMRADCLEELERYLRGHTADEEEEEGNLEELERYLRERAEAEEGEKDDSDSPPSVS